MQSLKRLTFSRITQSNYTSKHLHTDNAKMAQSKAKVGGSAINYDKTGTGPHPVLCMPGALGIPLFPFFTVIIACFHVKVDTHVLSVSHNNNE
jgi:hypothetical protein